MSELEIPERAVGSALAENVAGLTLRESMLIRLEAAFPIIVATELRRQADDLHELRRTIHDEESRDIMRKGIARLRKRADELDPDGIAW